MPGERRMTPAGIGLAADFPVDFKDRITKISHIKFFSKLSSIFWVNRSFESGFKFKSINLKNALTIDQCAFYMADCHRFKEIGS
jgi:hypothetical protein